VGRAGLKRSPKLGGFEKILDKKNERRYTPTILKALMFLDFAGEPRGFLATRRDSVLKLPKRVDRLQVKQTSRFAEIQLFKGQRCPLGAETVGF
jgi:hypothetical protein